MPGMVRRGATSAGRVRRPKPLTETFPPSNWPPGATTSLTGSQSSQFRPDSQSDRKYDLKNPATDSNRALWTTSPGSPGPQYPLVTNVVGSSGNGTNTWLYGGEIQGNDDINTGRDIHYAHTSGITVGTSASSGYAIADNQKVRQMGDGMRFLHQGTCYVKRFYGKDISDGFVEFDEVGGNAVIYDCLIEGCYTGISHSDSSINNSGNTLTIDGLLLWLKPTVDTPTGSGGVWCGGTGGCTELDGVWSDSRFRGSNGIWEGQSNSYGTVVIRNSWFRIDRPSVWGPASGGWPGQSGALWNNSATLTIGQDVKILWTGATRTLTGGEITAGTAAYPYTVPSGVQLVTGQTALDMWNRAATAWKTAHGY